VAYLRTKGKYFGERLAIVREDVGLTRTALAKELRNAGFKKLMMMF